MKLKEGDEKRKLRAAKIKINKKSHVTMLGVRKETPFLQSIPKVKTSVYWSNITRV